FRDFARRFGEQVRAATGRGLSVDDPTGVVPTVCDLLTTLLEQSTEEREIKIECSDRLLPQLRTLNSVAKGPS
ncbi:hypothetical protein LCGC14_3109310, partial [marine sediment metagenome]